MDPRRRPPSTSHSTYSTSYNTSTNNETSYGTTSFETRTANRTSYNTAVGNAARSATRVSTSNPLLRSSNPYHTTNDTTTESRPRTARRSTGRPGTARPGTARPGTAATNRPRTGYSTLGVENQEIICAISESRGVSPSVGMAFVNLDTHEAVLCQMTDSQTYVRTTHKLAVFNPSTICMLETAAESQSKLFSIIDDNIDDMGATLTLINRQYYSENLGMDFIQQLSFDEDVDSIRTAVTGNYYSVCSFAAVMKFLQLGMAKTVPAHSLRIKYEPSEGCMMIDLATIQSLELVQNLHDSKSRDCLSGLLNETLTPMGGRLLRSSILQPLTDPETIAKRYDAVEELSTKEDMFFALRQALKPFLDADKILTQLIMIGNRPTVQQIEQSVNNVIMLKHFVSLIQPVFEALAGSRCEMLQTIYDLCADEKYNAVRDAINSVVNEDTAYAKQPLDLRNQRTYAVKSGVNGLLDVARQTYKESMTDALQHIHDVEEEHNIKVLTKFDNSRQFYLRIKAEQLEDRNLPPVFINVYRRKDIIEMQTLDLVKRNQKIGDAHQEVLLMSDKQIDELILGVRAHMASLFKIAEAVGMLDMLCAFAHVVVSQDYVRPFISETGTLALRGARHPIREKIHNTKFIPNDVYATQQSRFQIITGSNMSGKSTYIRSVALMTIMAQVGCFVPAQHASFPIIRQLFARVSMDDNIEANVSTFAAEMRETAFILRNIDRSSMAIIDELGRGTSTTDGMAIALAIAEALVESRAYVWFATHFRDLANILQERNGVLNLHLSVDMSEENRMAMKYRVAAGTVQDEHYGLKLARILPLPPDVIEHAELVSQTLERQMRRRKQHSVSTIHARRRKLMLNLKEHLNQAKEGSMGDKALTAWLKQLQEEFVTQMTKLDDEMKRLAAAGHGDTDAEDDEVLDEAETQTDGRTITTTEKDGPPTFVDENGIEHVDMTGADESTGRSTAGDTSRNITTETS